MDSTTVHTFLSSPGMNRYCRNSSFLFLGQGERHQGGVLAAAGCYHHKLTSPLGSIGHGGAGAGVLEITGPNNAPVFLVEGIKLIVAWPDEDEPPGRHQRTLVADRSDGRN